VGLFVHDSLARNLLSKMVLNQAFFGCCLRLVLGVYQSTGRFAGLSATFLAFKNAVYEIHPDFRWPRVPKSVDDNGNVKHLGGSTIAALAREMATNHSNFGWIALPRHARRLVMMVSECTAGYAFVAWRKAVDTANFVHEVPMYDDDDLSEEESADRDLVHRAADAATAQLIAIKDPMDRARLILHEMEMCLAAMEQPEDDNDNDKDKTTLPWMISGGERPAQARSTPRLFPPAAPPLKKPAVVNRQRRLDPPQQRVEERQRRKAAAASSAAAAASSAAASSAASSSAAPATPANEGQPESRFRAKYVPD